MPSFKPIERVLFLMDDYLDNIYHQRQYLSIGYCVLEKISIEYT